MSYERLWHYYYRSKDGETRGPQAPADAVDCYKKSERLTEQIELNFLEDDLSWAAWYGAEEVVGTLVRVGAKIDRTDAAGYTALHRAARKNNGKIVRRLLKANATTEIRSLAGSTALHGVFLWKNSTLSREHQLQTSRVVRMLMEEGANVDTTANEGQSVLWTAAQIGSTTHVQILLDNGVHGEISNDGCRTALCIASRHGYEDVVKLLQERLIFSAISNACARYSQPGML